MIERRVKAATAPALIIGPRSLGSSELAFFQPSGGPSFSGVSWEWVTPKGFSGVIIGLRIGTSAPVPLGHIWEFIVTAIGTSSGSGFVNLGPGQSYNRSKQNIAVVDPTVLRVSLLVEEGPGFSQLGGIVELSAG